MIDEFNLYNIVHIADYDDIIITSSHVLVVKYLPNTDGTMFVTLARSFSTLSYQRDSARNNLI